jgi:hypothetical protein
MHNEEVLLSFAKQVGMYCVGLRLDYLHWMLTADLRRFLSNFRSVVRFHTGNVALSKRTLVHDIGVLFPFLKYLTLLISFDGSTSCSVTTGNSSITDATFQDLWTSFNQINELEHVSLVLEGKKSKSERDSCRPSTSIAFLCLECLSSADARQYVRSACDSISKIHERVTLVSVEENGYTVNRKFTPTDVFNGQVTLSLTDRLKHLILAFRPMLSMQLILNRRDSTAGKLQLQTLVLPCLPSTLDSINLLDLSQLRILEIGQVDFKSQEEWQRLDAILLCHRKYSLHNLTIHFNDFTFVRLVLVQRDHPETKSVASNEQFNSVFENCFDPPVTIEDDDDNKEKQEAINSTNESSIESKVSANCNLSLGISFV